MRQGDLAMQNANHNEHAGSCCSRRQRELRIEGPNDDFSGTLKKGLGNIKERTDLENVRFEVGHSSGGVIAQRAHQQICPRYSWLAPSPASTNGFTTTGIRQTASNR